MNESETKKAVRKGYARIAKQESSCGCCCGTPATTAGSISRKIGYSEKDLKSAPEGANLGLGCGNPVALASLTEGETVLDLGSGAGFDCFLASARVGAKGKVIGVDMTPEMLDRARENARKDGYHNVEFRLGEIENLPVADNTADIAISNCVINLSPDKKRVFSEVFRALKPSGRLMVSDIVLNGKLPKAILSSIAAYVGCISGASQKEDYLKTIKAAGFKDVKIVDEASFDLDCMSNDPTAGALIKNLNITPEQMKELSKQILSIKVSAVKPSAGR